jgi:hypothetical protein
MLKPFLTQIADAFRAALGTSENIPAQSFHNKVDDVRVAGYQSGYKQGKTDGYGEGYEEGASAGIASGKRAERTAFWKQFQNNGKRVYYNNAFFGSFAWNDSIYDPIYPIVSNNANSIFQQSGITDTKVDVDLSGCGTGTANTTFDGSKYLKTIHKLIVPAGLKYNNTFRNCTALENIDIEGTIGNSVSFGDSPLLSAASMKSIVESLAYYDLAHDQWGENNLTVSEKAWGDFETELPFTENMPTHIAVPVGTTRWVDFVNYIGWNLVTTKEE